MPNFRRFYIPDSIVFITCVTYQRNHYLESEKDIAIFWQTLKRVQAIHPFHLLAYVILPEHFHWLLKRPEGSPNFSEVMQSIKRNHTNNFKKAYEIKENIHIWQERFWDHVIRDEEDLERHYDYIHWNPVKHEYVQDPAAWKESSLHYWIGNGNYQASWGIGEEPLSIHDLSANE